MEQRNTDDTIKDMRKTMIECLQLLGKGSLITVAFRIKELAIRLDSDGLGTPTKTIMKEKGI